jgi:hypothetical protein
VIRVEWERRDVVLLLATTAAAALARALHLAAAGMPVYDPWRHLSLIRNLRRGAGFTLYDGQPYIWYAPGWHQVAASVPAWLPPDALAAIFSSLCAPLVYAIARTRNPIAGGTSRESAAIAALAWAFAGPAVAFTCHYGSEALAIFGVLVALLAAQLGSRPAVLLAAGVALGAALALRMNLAFLALLFVPLLHSRPRALAAALGAALPIAALAWRNHAIIGAHPFVFSWDGLATRSADFGPLAMLSLQFHPSVREALWRLHSAILPSPEWLSTPEGWSFGPLLFLIAGTIAVLLSRDRWLIAAAATAIVGLVGLDPTLSSRWFRVWVGVVPLFCLAIARLPVQLAAVLAAVLLAGGATTLIPRAEVPLQLVTPPPELVREDAYLVNSGFFQPESLIYRYPQKRFIGLPLHAAELTEFLAAFPGYDTVLWHDLSVQNEVLESLRGAAGFTIVREGVNEGGLRYRVLRRPE